MSRERIARDKAFQAAEFILEGTKRDLAAEAYRQLFQFVQQTVMVAITSYQAEVDLERRRMRPLDGPSVN